MNPLSLKENNAKSSISHFPLEEGMALSFVGNETQEPQNYICQPDPQSIQYYFAINGNLTFSFNGGRYQRDLALDHSLLLYQPGDPVRFDITIPEGASMLALFIDVKQLHSYFLQDLGVLPFLESENINKRYFEERPVSNSLAMVISQVINEAHVPSNTYLYYRAKVLEILSFYFHRAEDDSSERCPFLLDEEKVAKLRQVKLIMQDTMLNPPSLKDLAKQVGLNEYQLKVGFKNIYGKSVFQYLTNYKMQIARELLDQQNLRVNEVSDKVGYSNPSHFIVAFKRQFGVTPKKYLMSLR